MAPYIFVNDLYYQTLKSQIGGNIPVFVGVRQRGGGLGSVLGHIAKYAIPLFAKYILPHAKEAAVKTISDVAGGQSFKKSAKDRGINLLKKIGSQVLQAGNGVVVRRRTNKKKLGKSIILNRVKPKKRLKQKRKKNITKIRKHKKAKRALINRSRLDIFS